jgi:hypothetical protein
VSETENATRLHKAVEIVTRQPTVWSFAMSKDLDLVSQVMYLPEGENKPGDEAKVERLERKLLDWKRNIVDRVGKELPMPLKADMASNMVQVGKKWEGYWCKGEKCISSHTHWVLHSSETICWDCWHDPCACSAPLVWDKVEQAYYYFFNHAMVKLRQTSGCWNQPVTLQR